MNEFISEGQGLSGYLVIDKPLGMSSAQAVGAVKRVMRRLGVPLKGPGACRIGHGGTLDPLASGVLPLALGEATKTVGYVLHGDKAYDFTIRWGAGTATLDAEGEITATSAVRPSGDEICAALPGFIGTISQLPPAYSALKVNGQRAYAMARAGVAVELAARQVEIGALTLLDCPDADHARFSLACGKGTYVRALARDLAVKLGTVGHLTALRRTRAGPFGLAHAISLEKLGEITHITALQTALVPLATVLDDIPALAVTASDAAKLRHGQQLWNPGSPDLAPGTTVLVTCDGVPVALCETTASGSLGVLRGFNL